MSQTDISRRNLVKIAGLGAVATVAATGANEALAKATPKAAPKAAVPAPQTHKFDMTIEEARLTVARGFETNVWAYNGQVPGPLIRVREGDSIEAHVTNNTRGAHTIHWHGIHQKNTWRMDGAPGINTTDINSGGGTDTYKFVADRKGSLWYHCHVEVPNHVGVRGMWGPLIVDPLEPLPIEKEVTKDAILMFSAWNSEVADDYFAKQDPTDNLNYFSVNGKSFPYNQPIRVQKGDVLRLRLYGASIDVAFHLHGHDMLVTHRDGLPVPAPYYADTVYVAMGQRVDVIVRCDNPGRWPAHDHNDHHLSNDGNAPGGLFTIIEYDEVGRDDPWYLWRRKEYDPDFYFVESMKKGYGLITQSGFKGQKIDEI
ncbi:hypothetical protein GCM10007094_31390 [Pseudovibrio japonicus]|uniref:Copper-containing nitrite reductase n=1 Tax=Pseudovibrio japonicus TaxID=366534 RepID=A0ABQ3ELE0_9HYPH|nr:multicopper oxidase domain-containing protein [Pseudovibrio japonicus]GHB39856.1 hypothetical protein GCM10007094_31390 [Pseudovibrio japonicus]